jgi:hypothetical protein
MSAAKDFRAFGFDPAKIRKAGSAIGRAPYMKLYTIENIVRVLIHSILSAQVGPGWWTVSVDPTRQQKATNFRQKYLNKPWHGMPGTHDIYYLDLADLNEIIRANLPFFRVVIPEIDQLMTQLELIRLPRNIVCHMNWPTKIDKQRIDLLLHDMEVHVARLQKAGAVPLLVPQ